MSKELSPSQKVKRELTKKFPKLKFSVRGGWATYTGKIDISILEIEENFINPIHDYNHKTHYINIGTDKQIQGLTSFNLIKKGYGDARRNFTGKTKKVIDDIFKIIETHYGKHEKGDPTIDSFDNYFFSINFGKRDKSLIYNGVSIVEVYSHLEYMEEVEYTYKDIITTGIPSEYENFDDLQTLHLNYLLSLLPKQEVSKPKKSTSLVSTDFDAIFQEATIEDFTHTKTGKKLKVLKLANQLSKDNFSSFRNEIKKRGLGYYSRFAKGFILEEEVSLCKTA